MDARALRTLQRPISLMMLSIWIMNDSFLKEKYHNFWTGKLSDLGSLFIFPIVLTFVLSCFYKKSGEFLFRFSLLFTGILFCSINISQDWNDFYTYTIYGNLFGKENVIRGRADITDILCLPMLYFSYLLYKRMEDKEYYPKEIVLGFLMLAFSFFATVNTSCGDCGRRRNDNLLLYLLSQPLNLNLDAPADSSKFLKGDTIEFKWNFQGKEATPNYMEKYPYATAKTEGGKFVGYRIQIFSTSDIQSDTKPVFESADTTSLSLQTKADITQGTYYWIPVLVFEHGEQKEKRIEFLNKKYRTIHLSF
jgi:hypothetical protein